MQMEVMSWYPAHSITSMDAAFVGVMMSGTKYEVHTRSFWREYAKLVTSSQTWANELVFECSFLRRQKVIMNYFCKY